MNILYIGQVVSDDKIGACSAYSATGNHLQKNIICKLNEKFNVGIHVVSVFPNKPWPQDELKIYGAVDSMGNNLLVRNYSYWNIPIIKQCVQENVLYKAGLNIIQKSVIDLIMVYNMYPQFGRAALRISQKANIPLVAILADFPNDKCKFFGGSDGILTRIMNVITWNNIKKLHFAVVLNENARKYMDDNNKIVIVPGGIDESFKEKFTYTSVNNYDVIYAGALTDYSGVLNLIKAVEETDIPEICLKIYGAGPLEEDIRKKSFGKIRYMGQVAFEEMKSILRNSWILVNPRSTEEFVSTVTFPSKIFEYIMACRPVISTEFSGMPDVIRKAVWSCGDGSPEKIKKAIEDIYIMDENSLYTFVKKSYKKIADNYNWDKNCNAIYDFLWSICNNQ